MAVTIHVNGKSNSLAHKGCMGITKSTIPDVCKTPSPGGPIPVPYPVIVSMSNSLAKGTKSVKVDGGNSAAIKGSEYSRCSGDEPGTAGGVKSSTNMKEATWILYSFDVKLEGKNACRLSDKMMMNHGNTACLMGTMHAPVPGDEACEDEIVIECKVENSVKKNWDCCQLSQYCAKIEEVDDQVRRKKFEKPTENYEDLRDAGNDAAKNFRDGWNKAAREGVIASFPKEARTPFFFDDCAHDKAESNGFEIEAGDMSPDHVHEIQSGGSATNYSNLRWLDGSVNKSVQSATGTAAKKYDEKKSQCVSADCCPAESTFCAGKTPDQKLLS